MNTNIVCNKYNENIVQPFYLLSKITCEATHVFRDSKRNLNEKFSLDTSFVLQHPSLLHQGCVLVQTHSAFALRLLGWILAPTFIFRKKTAWLKWYK